VKKNIVDSEIWSNVMEDWLKINTAIQNKYGKANMEYQELLSPRQR